MKKSFTLCLLLAATACFGQFIPNQEFNELETIPCPFNDSVTIKTYKDWVLYQTLDGKWDGPIDSSLCVGLSWSNPNNGIDLQTADLSKPIFARCKFTEDNKVLLKTDWLYSYQFTSYHPNSDQVYFKGGTDCPDNMCSGMIIGIQIPDEAGTGTAMRWYRDIPSASESNIIYFETCLPTEYFDHNYLREFIIKMKTEEGTSPNEKIKLNYVDYYDYDIPKYVNEVLAPAFTFVDTSYEVPIEYVADQSNSWNFNYLLRYTDTNIYPSSANLAYVEGRPEVNTPDPKTINLIIGDWETFVPQPFAALRGALVEGSDSIRHHVNLVNLGGDICMPGVIDFVFDENTKYINAGGHVNLEGLNSCMMFRNGGSFEVAEGTTMEYGQDGRGVLVLRSGGQLRLGKGSTLRFDGLLWLQGIATDKHPDPQFYVDLTPGTQLVFGEKAHVYNALSTSPDVKLNVYMNGGTLDDSKLSPAARLLINRIYPKPSQHFADNVRVLQNLRPGHFQVEYVSAGQELLQVEVFDMQGRLAWSQSFEAAVGHNLFQCGFDGGVTGVYAVTLSANAGRAAAKLAKFE